MRNIRNVVLGAGMVAAAGFYAALVAPVVPVANAVPGQCQQVSFLGFSGGFCDDTAMKDGSFSHCETGGAFGMSTKNCYQACLDPGGHPYPTDLDENTPC